MNANQPHLPSTKTPHHRYEDEFLGSPQLKDDLPVLLSFYAEDVVRTLEREVRDVEREIRWVGKKGLGGVGVVVFVSVVVVRILGWRWMAG